MFQTTNQISSFRPSFGKCPNFMRSVAQTAPRFGTKPSSGPPGSQGPRDVAAPALPSLPRWQYVSSLFRIPQMLHVWNKKSTKLRHLWGKCLSILQHHGDPCHGASGYEIQKMILQTLLSHQKVSKDISLGKLQ